MKRFEGPPFNLCAQCGAELVAPNWTEHLGSGTSDTCGLVRRAATNSKRQYISRYRMRRAVKCSRKGLTDARTNGQNKEGGPYALQT
jgi:hypothetical protein